MLECVCSGCKEHFGVLYRKQKIFKNIIVAWRFECCRPSCVLTI